MKYSNITYSSIIAGSIDGICTCPLDNLKTRCHLTPHTTLIQSYGGMRSLFNGLLPYTSQIITKTVLRFSMYNEILHVMTPHCVYKEHAVMTAGFFAGIIEGFMCTTPLERIKIYSQTLGYPNLSIHGMTDLIKVHGFTTLWKGWLPTILRQGTSLMTRFVFYDAIHEYLEENTTRTSKSGNAFLAGGIAGICSIVLNNPFDVIKTSIQAGRTNGIFNTFHHLFITHGFSMMYSGLRFRIPRIFMSQGITFSVYEMFSVNREK